MMTEAAWTDPRTWAERHTYETCDLLVERRTFAELLKKHCDVDLVQGVATAAQASCVEYVDLGDASAYRWENGTVAIYACDGWYFGRLHQWTYHADQQVQPDQPRLPYAVSPSRAKDYLRCARRWAWRVLAHRPEPRTDALEQGERAHAIAECWLRWGIDPELWGGPEAQWVLESLPNLPRPGTALVEQVFRFQLDGVWFTGKGDCVHVPSHMKLDHKFVGDLRYALTPDTLLEDPQALIYVLAPPVFDSAMLRWVYNEKRRRKSTPVEAHCTYAHALEYVRSELVPPAREMSALHAHFQERQYGGDTPTAVNQIPCNTEACYDFNRPCPHIAVCTRF